MRPYRTPWWTSVSATSVPRFSFVSFFFCLHSVSLFLFFLWRRVRETTTATATTILQIRAAVVERRRELDKLEIRFDCITFYTGINRSLNNLNAGEWFFMQIEWLIDGPLALEFQSSFLLGFISIFFWWSFFFQRCQFVNHFFVFLLFHWKAMPIYDFSLFGAMAIAVLIYYYDYDYDYCSYCYDYEMLGWKEKKNQKNSSTVAYRFGRFGRGGTSTGFPWPFFFCFHTFRFFFDLARPSAIVFFCSFLFFLVPFSVAYISTKNHHRNNKKEEKETEREEKGRNVRRNRNESKKIIRVSFIHYPSTHRWFQCHGSLFVFSLLQQQQKKTINELVSSIFASRNKKTTRFKVEIRLGVNWWMLDCCCCCCCCSNRRRRARWRGHSWNNSTVRFII